MNTKTNPKEQVVRAEGVCGPNEETHSTLGDHKIAPTKDEAEAKVIEVLMIDIEVNKRKEKCADLNCGAGGEFECAIELLDYAAIHNQMVFNPVRVVGYPNRVGWICKWPGGDVKSRCTCVPKVS